MTKRMKPTKLVFFEYAANQNRQIVNIIFAKRLL